jgi:hypothetical protein
MNRREFILRAGVVLAGLASAALPSRKPAPDPSPAPAPPLFDVKPFPSGFYDKQEHYVLLVHPRQLEEMHRLLR